MNKRLRRNNSGNMVETVCGCIILVIVALFLVDVAAIVICQTQNDALAKHCARAAANKDDYTQANAAKQKVVDEFNASNGGSKICVSNGATLDAGYFANAQAYVQSTVTCNFPVPIPFGPSSMQFRADAIEPVVAIMPP
jgi:Flp pilus assembly protein TadG